MTKDQKELSIVKKAPAGCAALYRQIYRSQWTAEELSRILTLVAVEVSQREVRGWSELKRVQAGAWAARTHLRASDNPVRVPPTPRFIAVALKATQRKWKQAAKRRDARGEPRSIFDPY